MKDTVIDTDEVKNKVSECNTKLTSYSQEISLITTNSSLLASLWRGIDSDKSIDAITSAGTKYTNILNTLLEMNGNLELVTELYEEKDNTEF